MSLSSLINQFHTKAGRKRDEVGYELKNWQERGKKGTKERMSMQIDGKKAEGRRNEEWVLKNRGGEKLEKRALK